MTQTATVLGQFDVRKKRVLDAINKLTIKADHIREIARNSDGTVGDPRSRIIYDQTAGLVSAIEAQAKSLEFLCQQIEGSALIPDPAVRGGPNDL